MLKANPQTKKKVSVLGTTEDVFKKKGDNWKCVQKKVETTESVTEKYFFFLMPKATQLLIKDIMLHYTMVPLDFNIP